MIDSIPFYDAPTTEFVITKDMLDGGNNIAFPKDVILTDEALVFGVEKGFLTPTEEQLKKIDSYKEKHKEEKEIEIEVDDKRNYEIDFILKKLGLDEKQVKILFEKFR